MLFARRNAATLLNPFSVKPSGRFEGNDGSWSTFLLSIGNPAQSFRALVSTSSFSTWLPTPDGCTYPQDPQYVPGDCSELRGVGLSQGFQSNGYEESNGTFKYIGINTLDVGNDLSITDTFGSTYNTTADLGLDTVALKDSTGSAELSPKIRVPVFGVSSWNFFLPSLGVGDGYLQSTTQNSPSLLETLANQSYIPSRSWSYTAGASYRNYLGSLVLGGYDETRLEPNTTTYYSLPPSSHASELQVSLSSIAFNFANGTEASVPVSQNAVIDSTLPFFYLPSAVCDSLANKLSLTYDDATDLFTINADHLAANKNDIKQIRITVGDTQNSGNTTSITLPYAAFDLTATWPTYDQNQSQAFFPVRRAPGNTFIIGRTFLQEAHLSVDFERAYFNLSQAAFPSTRTDPKLVPIYNVSAVEAGVPSSSSSYSRHLGGGAIAGIVVGSVIAALMVIAFLVWFLFFRKRRQEKRRSEHEPMISRKLSSIIPPMSPSPDSSHRTDIDPISPIDGQFLHIRRVSELGTETAHESRAGVNVLPGIHEIAGLEKPPMLHGESSVVTAQSSPSTHHSTPRSELGKGLPGTIHSSPSNLHSTPRSELEG
jgi:hypothetical protein